MISHLYAIADAGGNIYPGTFSPWSHVAMINHLGNPPLATEMVDGGPIPLYGEPARPWRVKPVVWAPYAERGDHVVYCRIETNESVIVEQVKD